MRGRIERVVNFVSETFRVVGSGLSGLMPATRSADGTFGTQRAQSQRAADRRRADFPTD